MDVYDYLNIRKELEKAKTENLLKTALWANMSHEIRTPVNAIVGFARLMAECENTEERKEYLNIIEENNILLSQMISDILDLSQIETHTLQIHKADFDINILLEEILQSSRVRNKNERIKIQLDEMEYLNMYSDKIRISQIINNFINNALKYTVSGVIHLGCRAVDKGGALYFYVSDTGKGIPKDKQQDIFERYVQLGIGGNGVGLGLSICRQLVKILGGEIGVVSEEGKGSTFWFKLPLLKRELQPEENIIQDANNEKIVEQTENVKMKEIPLVLIAEDDPSNYRLMELLLKKDYCLEHAWDGVEAVELYNKYKPNIILMDISMPNMNGYQAFNKIKSINPNVPIIAVTAYAMSNEEHNIMQFGFDGYLSKPININSFKAEISKYIK